MVRVPKAAREVADRAVKQLSLPGTYLRLRQAMGKPNSSMADMAKVLGADADMSAHVLRVANSTLYPCAREIDSVQRAVSLFGMQLLHDIALATAVTGAFSSLRPGTLDMDAFWQRSMCCALLARTLGKRQGADADRLFLAGLMGDIGTLVVRGCAPDSVREAFESIPPWQPQSADHQLQAVAFSQAHVGAALLDSWSLPPLVVDCIARQDDPMKGGPLPDELCVLHICARAADAHATGQEMDAAVAHMVPDTLQDCRLDLETLIALYCKARESIEPGLEALFPACERVA